jgi:hypothetical protein
MTPRHDRTLLTCALLLAVSALAGCRGPCDRLEEQLCAQRDASAESCARWGERIRRVDDKTCQRSLRLLEAAAWRASR